MGFASRRLGECITLELAECAEDKDLRESLRQQGVRVGVKMVSPEVRDECWSDAQALDIANARDLKAEKRAWSEDDKDVRGEEPKAAAQASMRVRNWMTLVFNSSLEWIEGWHSEVDAGQVTGAALGLEIEAYSLPLAVQLARRCVVEQYPSDRQAKS